MNNNAMVSLVTGIMSIFIPVFGIILSIVGIIYANKGLKEIEITKEEGKNYAKAGKVCSAIGLSIQLVLFIILVLGSYVLSFFAF